MHYLKSKPFDIFSSFKDDNKEDKGLACCGSSSGIGFQITRLDAIHQNLGQNILILQ